MMVLLLYMVLIETLKRYKGDNMFLTDVVILREYSKGELSACMKREFGYDLWPALHFSGEACRVSDLMDRFEFAFVGFYTYSQLGWGNPMFYIPLCRRNVDTTQFVHNFQTNAIHYVKVGSKMSKLLTDIYNATEGAIQRSFDIYLLYNRPSVEEVN